MNEHATIQGVTAMTSNNQVLQALKELGPFYYQPNPGNMGDHLIAHATREFFRKNSLPFSPFFMETLQRSEPFPLVYGGGGPFVPYYGMVPEIMRLLANPAVSRVVILPSSFYQCDEVAELLDERVTVFCREERSFRYLSRLNRRARVLLAHDMAFTLDARQAVRNLPEEILNDPEFREKAALAGEGLHLLEDGRKALLFLRTDAEAGPESRQARECCKSFDLSGLARGSTVDEERGRFYSGLFLHCLDQADVVLTDRLHGAIGAYLLGKETWLLDNSYGKISGVYDFSMKGDSRTTLLQGLEKFPYADLIAPLSYRCGKTEEEEGAPEDGVEKPDRKKIKILVGICSAQGYSERRNAVRETWLSHPHPDVKCMFFLGGDVPEKERKDTVGLDAPDSYNALPRKVLAFFRHALEHEDFDWLFKCDDDTFLDLSRLPELVDDRYGIIGDEMLGRRMAPSGGAGYLLSRRTVEKLVSPAFAGRVPCSGAEDLIFGKLALETGAVPHATPRLFMSNTRYPAPGNSTVSAHWCSPELLHALETLRHDSPVTAYRGRHEHWQDELLFYRNGVFRRRRSDCYGWWNLGADNVLTLRWKVWRTEQLSWRNGAFVGSTVRLERMEGMPSLWELARKEGGDGMGKVKKAEARTEYIHAGCGDRFLEGWLNVDLPHYDLTVPLPWEDGTVKALFLEHVAEYLSPVGLVDFLKEAWRVLKPGGVLRLAFTDTGRLAAEAPIAWRRFLRGRSGLSPLPGYELEALIGREGQQSFWSEDSLSGMLKLAAFSVSIHEPGQSAVTELCGLERKEARPEFPFELLGRRCLEAQKPPGNAAPLACPACAGRKSVSSSSELREEDMGVFVSPYFSKGQRTGNRLFQIAAVYAHALRHGLECRIPWRYEEITGRLYEMLGPETAACPPGGEKGPVAYREKRFSYDPIPAAVRQGRMAGYFQSEKYFSDQEKEIRKLYARLAAPRREGEAGVHVRLGDYQKLSHQYHSPDAGFLEEAFRRLSDNVRTLHIFSDSPRQALELVYTVPGASRFELVINEEDVLPALRTMSGMQELVVSCSSYSWWGAWLGNQEKVMIQKKWFIGEISDYEDVYRPGWTRL